MKIITKSDRSASELNQQIVKHLEELTRATDQARTSEEMLRYLNFCAKFHQYSAGNIWLIMLSKPDASYVAGFHKWKSMGRWVRKGEHGIPILAPIFIKVEVDKGLKEEQLLGFRTVYVFDVSQTQGKPLPPVPDWKSPEKNEELSKILIKFAKSKGIEVSIEELPGECQGVSQGGTIVLSPEAGTKTLIHELGHELLHQNIARWSIESITMELEAESVAFVVAKHFGFNDLNSPNYIALHKSEAKDILGCMERITRTAQEIIEYVDKEANNGTKTD